MLPLKLYPSEFRELIGYLKAGTEGQETVPLQHQTVGKLILLGYISKWTPIRIYVWKQRSVTKTYSFRLPVVVGLAIYQDMQGALLTHHQQLLLAKLDQAIVNYQNPYATISPFQIEAY